MLSTEDDIQYPKAKKEAENWQTRREYKESGEWRSFYEWSLVVNIDLILNVLFQS